MSTTHTDSHVVEHHEDGSWTETSIITHTPATKAQKAGAVAILGAVCFAPFVPLVGFIVAEKIEDRRNRRKAKKALTEETA